MRANRGLRLRKETLAELRPADLAGVAAGHAIRTLPLNQCLATTTSQPWATCTCCTGTASCEV